METAISTKSGPTVSEMACGEAQMILRTTVKAKTKARMAG